MLERELLKDLLHNRDFARKDKLLLILATDAAAPKTVAQIRKIAVDYGLRAAKQWNISDILARGDATAIRTSTGWELNSDGKARVAALTGTPAGSSPAVQAAVDLRAHLSAVSQPDTLAFLDEAITCLEAGALRAAVVLTWVGAVALLYDFVVTNHLAALNSEATRRDSRWKAAKNADDLARMKENDFLDVLEAISVLGKNVKQELQGCLKLRNACGHPNSLKLGERRVSAHIEILILNVFTQF